jgi:hypothetical protein
MTESNRAWAELTRVPAAYTQQVPVNMVIVTVYPVSTWQPSGTAEQSMHHCCFHIPDYSSRTPHIASDPQARNRQKCWLESKAWVKSPKSSCYLFLMWSTAQCLALSLSHLPHTQICPQWCLLRVFFLYQALEFHKSFLMPTQFWNFQTWVWKVPLFSGCGKILISKLLLSSFCPHWNEVSSRPFSQKSILLCFQMSRRHLYSLPYQATDSSLRVMLRYLLTPSQ